MALDDMQLSLMAFPARWKPSSRLNTTPDERLLVGNVLFLPVGDPTAPLGRHGPRFAGTTVHLTANLLAGLDDLPSLSSTPVLTVAQAVEPPPVATELFRSLEAQFTDRKVTVTSETLAPNSVSSARIRKSLPESYVQAFAFETPRTADLEVGDGYGCALRDQVPTADETPLPPDSSIAWGQILSYVLRQPALARALGLIADFELTVPVDLLADGGYVVLHARRHGRREPVDHRLAGRPRHGQVLCRTRSAAWAGSPAVVRRDAVSRRRDPRQRPRGGPARGCGVRRRIRPDRALQPADDDRRRVAPARPDRSRNRRRHPDRLGRRAADGLAQQPDRPAPRPGRRREWRERRGGGAARSPGLPGRRARQGNDAVELALRRQRQAPVRRGRDRLRPLDLDQPDRAVDRSGAGAPERRGSVRGAELVQPTRATRGCRSISASGRAPASCVPTRPTLSWPRGSRRPKPRTHRLPRSSRCRRPTPAPSSRPT